MSSLFFIAYKPVLRNYYVNIHTASFILFLQLVTLLTHYIIYFCTTFIYTVGIILNILSCFLIFASSNINEFRLNAQIEDEQVISHQITDHNIDSPNYDGDFDDDDADSHSCNCSSSLQLYYFTEGKYFYLSQFIGCFISYETDKSPPFLS